MNDDIAVKVENVSKDFLLPKERASSIKGIFTNLPKGSIWREKETQSALKNIDVEIKKGEFFGIVGRNGSGKSTLLKIIAGIYQPTKGSIQTVGKLVPFIELGVGFNPELTGRENVYLNGAMLGFSSKEVDDMYDSIVAFAELERFMDQKLKNYSSGMEVRLAFSMAVRAQGDVLIIDEVLAVGDADFQRKCYRYFKQLKREKKTVIFVTHDMDSVREYCDRAMVIENQEMITIGTPDEAAREYMKIMTPSQVKSDEATEQADRWGDGVCRISDIKIESLNDKNLTFSYVTTAEKDCEDPVYGFRIRNSEGVALMGTNSLILGNKPKLLKAGQKVKTVWKVENVFAEGNYLLDTAIVYEGTLTVADWWDESLQFEISRDRRTPYLVEPEIVIEEKLVK